MTPLTSPVQLSSPVQVMVAPSSSSSCRQGRARRGSVNEVLGRAPGMGTGAQQKWQRQQQQQQQHRGRGNACDGVVNTASVDRVACVAFLIDRWVFAPSILAG